MAIVELQFTPQFAGIVIPGYNPVLFTGLAHKINFSHQGLVGKHIISHIPEGSQVRPSGNEVGRVGYCVPTGADQNALVVFRVASRHKGGNARFQFDVAANEMDLSAGLQNLQIVGAIARAHSAAPRDCIVPFPLLDHVGGPGESRFYSLCRLAEGPSRVVKVEVRQHHSSYLFGAATNRFQRVDQAYLRIKVEKILLFGAKAITGTGIN